MSLKMAPSPVTIQVLSVEEMTTSSTVLQIPLASSSSLEGTWGDCYSSSSVEDDLVTLLGITSTTTTTSNENATNAIINPGYGIATTTTDYVNYINTPVMSEEEGEEMLSDPFAKSLDNVKMFFDGDDNQDIVFELDVPVLSQDFNSQWDSQVVKKEAVEEQKISFFGTNPMACFNPLDVEGKEMNLLFEAPAVVKKTKKILSKLVMPSSSVTAVVKQQQQHPSLSTPQLQSVIRQQKEESGFDLLEWVTNSQLPVDDPSFLQMLEDVSPPTTATVTMTILPELSTVELADITVTPPTSSQTLPSRKRKAAAAKTSSVTVTSSKRGRGRPSATVTSGSLAAAAATSTSSSDHSYMTNYDSSTSGFSTDDVKDAQYRRMRDLNNLASKRCRQNRKSKFDGLLDEEGKLRKTNAELRRKCKHMEDLVKEMKRKFIEKVTNPGGGGPKALLDLDGFFEKMQGVD